MNKNEKINSFHIFQLCIGFSDTVTSMISHMRPIFTKPVGSHSLWKAPFCL